MSTDIVVVGHRFTNTAGVVVTSYNFMGNSGDPVESYDGAANTDPSNIETKINISVNNAANADKAKEAAQNIANAVATIIAEAQKLPPATVIKLPDGKTTTAGKLLSDVKSTKFVVTDNPNYGNAGVGGANRDTMTDSVYFAAFTEGTGQSSYSNAQWLGQGILGTILHEIGHLSEAGYANFQAENSRWNREMAERKIPHGPADFYSLGRDYAFDNESYVHGYALAAAAALKINIDTYSAIMTSGGMVGSYVGPDSIYQQRKADEGL